MARTSRKSRAQKPVTMPTLPACFDMGADGPSQPRRVWGEVDVREVDIKTGEVVIVKTRVRKTSLPKIIEAMPTSWRLAAYDYQQAFEEVNAGGAIPNEGGGSGGTGQREGRQFHAVRLVDHLRRLEHFVGNGSTNLGGIREQNDRVAVISHIELVRFMCCDCLSVGAVLKEIKVPRSANRQAALLLAVANALQRMSISLGYEETIALGRRDIATKL